MAIAVGNWVGGKTGAGVWTAMGGTGVGTVVRDDGVTTTVWLGATAGGIVSDIGGKVKLLSGDFASEAGETCGL